MSDTKNHKLAIKAIIEAHRTPGKMREIMLTILADKPSAIVNAWGKVEPVVKSRKTGDQDGFCHNCNTYLSVNELKYCAKCHSCGHGLKQSESP